MSRPTGPAPDQPSSPAPPAPPAHQAPPAHSAPSPPQAPPPPGAGREPTVYRSGDVPRRGGTYATRRRGPDPLLIGALVVLILGVVAGLVFALQSR